MRKRFLKWLMGGWMYTEMDELLVDRFEKMIMLVESGHVIAQLKMFHIPTFGTRIEYRDDMNGKKTFEAQQITITQFGNVAWIEGKIVASADFLAK